MLVDLHSEVSNTFDWRDSAVTNRDIAAAILIEMVLRHVDDHIRLNRLRTGVGRFGTNMLRWGLSTSDICDCGVEQTADHITSRGRCPIYRPPEGMNGLIELDVTTRTWLKNNALHI